MGHGKPRRLVTKLLESHEVVTSSQLLAELVDVLSREKFAVTEEKQANQFLSIILRKATVVTVRRSFDAVRDDPEDDAVLNAAYEGKASHVISGDRHLLSLSRFRGIRIVTVNEMLDLL